MDIQTIRLILQVVTLLAVIVGLYLTIRQIRLFRQSYVALHDWNRRKAAQDALESTQKILFKDARLLDDHFQIQTRRATIPTERINELCKAHPGLRSALHTRLNVYEALAVGVEQKVFDEEVIKQGYKQPFRRAWNTFRTYIQDRREDGNEDAWKNFQHVTERWHKDLQRERQPTDRN